MLHALSRLMQDSLSANMIQLWLTPYDRGEWNGDEVEASVVGDYEAKIAALEREVGQPRGRCCSERGLGTSCRSRVSMRSNRSETWSRPAACFAIAMRRPVISLRLFTTPVSRTAKQGFISQMFRPQNTAMLSRRLEKPAKTLVRPSRRRSTSQPRNE